MTGQGALFDPAGARAAAEEGMARAINADRVATWRLDAETWFEGLARWSLITADDLIAAVGLPDPESGVAQNNSVGGWFAQKSKAQKVQFTGNFRKSARVARHGNLQRVWMKL